MTLDTDSVTDPRNLKSPLSFRGTETRGCRGRDREGYARCLLAWVGVEVWKFGVRKQTYYIISRQSSCQGKKINIRDIQKN